MEGPSISSRDVEGQLARMLAGQTFRGAERSSTLLRFVVEETLGGRADRLKDYTLGSEALGRGERFDPRTDPIARVEASRLRARLEVYYATEGAADPVVISLPKGAYVPQFRLRPVPPVVEPVPQTPSVGGPGWRAVVLIAIPAAVLLGVFLGLRIAPRPAVQEVRLEITTPPTTDPVSLALSPDGRSIVFVASADGTSQLWLRPLSETTARPLPGTENASLPFWSPDSRSIGFFADAHVKRLDIESGVVQAISFATVPAGGTWNRDDVILNPRVPDSPVFRTTMDGSSPAVQTVFASGQTGHRAPYFLPDGRQFLFFAVGEPDVRGVYVGELGAPTIRRLMDADAPAVFAPPNHVLYRVHETLFAQAIDPDSVTLKGTPVPLADGVASQATTGVLALSASAAGPIAYRTGPSGGRRQFVWFDRSGRELSRVGEPVVATASYASISPDFHRLTVQRSTNGNTDIWTIDLDRGASVRLTSDPQPDIAPVWAPNGDRIVYSSQEGNIFNLFVREVDSPTSQLMLGTDESKQATDWSRDGRWLLYRTISVVGAEQDMDIWALPLEGAGTPVPVIKTKFEERDAQFSPDGRWISYQSNESGQTEVYVRPFQREGATVRISTAGGVQARWRADGTELFYLTLDGELTVVPISLASDGASLQVGSGIPLFRAPVGGVLDVALFHYIVSPDGQRFLVDTVIEEQAAPITVILNWTPPPN